MKNIEENIHHLNISNKIIRIKTYENLKLKRKRVNLIVNGLLPYPIDTDNDFIQYPKSIAEKISKKIGGVTVIFDWFATSKNNYDISNLSLNNYIIELKLVISWIKTNFDNYRFNLITNSFGSLPLIKIISSNMKIIDHIIFMSPIIDTAYSSFKYRFSKKGRFLDLLINNNDDRMEKEKILSNYKSIKLDSIHYPDTLANRTMIIFGEFESEVRKISIDKFSKKFNIKNVTQFKGASHLVFKKDVNLPDDKKLTKKLFKKISNFLDS